MTSFSQWYPQLIRTAIDEVIDAPRTGRFMLDEIEKTEKTYIGTKIEILLRNRLQIPKGTVLDLSVNGVECDIKNTIGKNWSMPNEVVGHPSIVMRVNEKKALLDFGVLVVAQAYLNPGANRDAKRGISAAGMSNIWWILKQASYPSNFWEVTPAATRKAIFAAGSPKRSLAVLFESVQGVPIPRTVVTAIAQQDDPLKRVRRNGGARDILAPRGIAILWGKNDRALIAQLTLPFCTDQEFVSHTPRNAAEAALLRHNGHID